MKLLRAGINVAVGTDSRASNPDLNLFNELATVARLFPALDWHEVLSMGTINAAKALGVDTTLGSITPGKHAMLASVRLSDGQHAPETLFDGQNSCVPFVMATTR